jgi:hypothetical protein
MNDYDLYGRYYNRADVKVIPELVFDIVIALVVWFFTENWFYALICSYFAFNKTRQLNIKNRQFEILNRLDEIEERIKDK